MFPKLNKIFSYLSLLATFFLYWNHKKKLWCLNNISKTRNKVNHFNTNYPANTKQICVTMELCKKKYILYFLLLILQQFNQTYL